MLWHGVIYRHRCVQLESLVVVVALGIAQGACREAFPRQLAGPQGDRTTNRMLAHAIHIPWPKCVQGGIHGVDGLRSLLLAMGTWGRSAKHCLVGDSRREGDARRVDYKYSEGHIILGRPPMARGVCRHPLGVEPHGWQGVLASRKEGVLLLSLSLGHDGETRGLGETTRGCSGPCPGIASVRATAGVEATPADELPSGAQICA